MKGRVDECSKLTVVSFLEMTQPPHPSAATTLISQQPQHPEKRLGLAGSSDDGVAFLAINYLLIKTYTLFF